MQSDGIRLQKFFTSCFGLGRLPGAPGTWACLPVIALFGIIRHIGANDAAVTAFMLLMTVFGVVVCLSFGTKVAGYLGKSDPGEIVADEWAGQAVVLAGAAFIQTELTLVTMLTAFGLFRLFDILKPWPVRKLERLPGGVGILADDIAAGLMAMAVLLIVWKIGALEWLGRYVRFSNEMNFFTAVVLGAIQGLTEFLPVSSSGHLVLFEHIFGFQMDSEKNPSMLLFDLMVHVGTVLSVLIVMRRDISGWIRRVFQFGRYGKTLQQVFRRSPAVRIFILAIVANVITGIIGILFKRQFEGARQYLWVVVGGWVITAILLFSTGLIKKAKLGLRRFGPWEAAFIGLAQAAAILPGVSRSGATVSAGILLGLKRRWAVEFSFLIGVPLIMLASLKEFVDKRSEVEASGISFWSMTAGAIAACVVGIFALKVLIIAARRARINRFGWYCLALAIGSAVYILLS